MRKYSYPKTFQFLGLELEIKHRASYTGKDELENATYNFSLPRPKIPFTGTVKLHGKNSSICYNTEDGYYFQSRETIIDKGHNGFVALMQEHDLHELFESTFVGYREKLQDDETIVLYGEWAGAGVTAVGPAAIKQIDKCFYIFEVAVKSNIEEKATERYHYTGNLLNYPNIRSIRDYPTYSIEIDFNDPEAIEVAKNKMIELTDAVEQECPVAAKHGISGIGEGIVWTGIWDNIVWKFKTKGEEHSKKSKEPKKVVELTDEEKLAVKAVNEFCTLVVTEALIRKGIAELGIEIPSKAHTGKVLQKCKTLVFEQYQGEIDSLNASLVGKTVPTRIREVFFTLV